MGEPITQVEHALQTADLAWKDQSDHPQMVVAALLHDIGEVVEPESQHCELKSYALLAPIWGEKVARPVANLVKSKRFLLAVDGAYAVQLTEASLARGMQAGGPFAQDCQEYAAFKKEPYFQESIALRIWADSSKEASRSTSSFKDYHTLLVDVAYDNLRSRYSDAQIDEAISQIHSIDCYLKSRL